MKYILAVIVSLATLGMVGVVAAEPYVSSGPLCSVERTYVIKDSNGNVMDSTTYMNNWPIDCITRVEVKYREMEGQVQRGQVEFQTLSGQNP